MMMMMIIMSGPEHAGTELLDPQNRRLAFLGHKFTKFLPALWSLAVGTLFRGLESRGSVGEQFRLVSLYTCITISVFLFFADFFYKT